MDALPECRIDQGTFKYVLILCTDDAGRTKYIVRGTLGASYHDDVFQAAMEEAGALGLHTKVQGGGRIAHDASAMTISVYGYSVAFGAADHAVAVDILKRAYPAYADISFSNEGY